MTDEKFSPFFIPARMVNEYVYCPRLFYLEWVQGEWTDSVDTLKGNLAHKRVDKESGSLPESEADEEIDFKARSVFLSAERLGVIARMDIVEGHGRVACPVDYKKGDMPDIEGGVYEPEKIQLCVQGLILQENGFECTQGMIWYAGSRQKVKVIFDERLIARTLQILTEIRELLKQKKMPPPLDCSPKCPKCSLVEICLPDEVTFFRNKRDTDFKIRRLVPARQDNLPLYLYSQGAKLGIKDECIQVRKDGETIEDIGLKDVSSVSIFGNKQVSTQLMRELCSRNIPLSFFSYGGWFYGFLRGMDHKNVELRIKQFEKAGDKEFCAKLASLLVYGKIMNCRTMLRRNHPEPDQEILANLKRISQKALQTKDIETLLGLEGTAAQLYFSQFAGMLKKNEWREFAFMERNRRPPRDPVNCLLSYGYSLLVKDFTIAAALVGFDPYLGFYHQPRYGRPSLALDMMEEFRPLIVDSIVIICINNEIIKKDDFIVRNLGVSIKNNAKKKFIQAYSRRMETLITHPVFKYKISYRQVIEVQLRLLSRFIMDEIQEYPVFMTR